MVHVSLSCIELNRTFSFVEPHGSTKRLTSENRTPKTTPDNGNFMIDSLSATYHLSHRAQAEFLLSGSASDLENTNPIFPTVPTVFPLMSDTFNHYLPPRSSEYQVMQVSPRSPCYINTGCI